MGSTVGTIEERLILTIAHIKRAGGHAQLERDALAEILRLRTASAEPPADVRAEAEKIASVPTTEQIEDACSVDDDFEAEITRWLCDTENYRGAEIVKCLQDDLKVLRQAVVAFDMAVRLDAIEPPADAEVAQAYEKGVNEAVNAARFVVWGMDGESNTAIVNELLKIKVKGSPELAIAHDLAQAERAVIEAAMDWYNMAGPGGDECGTNALVTSCWNLEVARQRSAAAEEQG